MKAADAMDVRQLDLSNAAVIAQILAVQRKAYRLEARIVRYDRIPALHDTAESIRGSGERFFGLVHRGSVSAVVSVLLEESILTICRLVVDPSLHRRGMASTLLSDLKNRYAGISIFRVSTAAKNTPALRLYQENGFTVVRRWVTDDGLALTELEHRREPGSCP